MSNRIEVQRICEYCKNEFTAKTTVTKYCSHKCNQRHYKAKVKEQKIKKSNSETKTIKVQPIEEIKAKEFLTVREVSQLLNCSIRTAYNYIDSGTIKGVNLGQRMTRVKRSEIDKLFQVNTNVIEPEPIQYNIEDCLNMAEIQKEYGISEKALYDVIKRNKLPKQKKGKYVYVPKILINEILA